MKHYIVTNIVTQYRSMEVEANSEEEAIETAIAADISYQKYPDSIEETFTAELDK